VSTSFVTTSLMVATFALLAQYAPMPKRSSPWNFRFGLTFLINEQPFLGFWWLVAGTVPSLISGRIHGATAWLAAGGLVALAAGALAVVAAEALEAGPALDAALAEVGARPLHRNARRLPWFRIVLLPFVSYRPDVRRTANVRYGPARRAHRLDVYTARRGRQDAPVLIYFHGGTFRMGSKLLGSRALIYRLASRGWVCISADYRIRRGTRYADQLDDAAAVLDWVRTNIASYGGDAGAVFLAGGSAGAHLAATAALTDRDPRRPIAGVIPLYGYYGSVDGDSDLPSSPIAHVNRDAPPFFIVHGSRDTLVLPSDARTFAEALARQSTQPVAYAELPGAQHNFDLFHSLRFHAVIDAIEAFTALALARGGPHASA
jgi:acetyl esterase/lipase